MAGENSQTPVLPPIQPAPAPETASSSENSQKEEEDEDDHVMSEIHLGCPPKFSGSFVSHFTFSLPPEHPKNKFDVAIQHNVTSSIPNVGLQVWRAELALSDFVLYKMFTSSDFDGIVAVELGAGTGLVGMLLSRVAKTVFLTDHGVEILENCASNVNLNSKLLPSKSSVYVRELDWKASWPPKLDNCAACKSFAWNQSEIDELKRASLLVAADVIYSDDLTDALFCTLERLMKHGLKKVLYLALEKRYNFSVDDLDVVANGYSRFRSYVRDEIVDDAENNGLQNGSLSAFVGSRIDLTKIPLYADNYNRGHDLELWKIKYVREDEKPIM